MSRLTGQAPSKLNLTLDIVGRRADGYHELRTVMQTVDWADTVTVERLGGEGITLWLSDPNLPCDRRNTAFAAAEGFLKAWQQRGEVPFGVRVEVEKIIPQQAGMAGGSADAAAVLRLLNELTDRPFSTEELCAIGVQIGADVPFCVRGGAALCTGIGEVMTPVKGLSSDLTVVVCKPPVNVSTGEAYAAVDDKMRAVTPSDEKGLLQALAHADTAGVGARLHNAFEQALCLPEVTAVLNEMKRFSPLGCRMTGSGSATFALFADETAAERCAEALKGEANQPPLGQVFCCHPC